MLNNLLLTYLWPHRQAAQSRTPDLGSRGPQFHGSKSRNSMEKTLVSCLRLIQLFTSLRYVNRSKRWKKVYSQLSQLSQPVPMYLFDQESNCSLWHPQFSGSVSHHILNTWSWKKTETLFDLLWARLVTGGSVDHPAFGLDWVKHCFVSLVNRPILPKFDPLARFMSILLHFIFNILNLGPCSEKGTPNSVGEEASQAVKTSLQGPLLLEGSMPDIPALSLKTYPNISIQGPWEELSKSLEFIQELGGLQTSSTWDDLQLLLFWPSHATVAATYTNYCACHTEVKVHFHMRAKWDMKFVEPADHHANPHSNHVLTLTVKTQYCNVDTLLWGNNQNEHAAKKPWEASICSRYLPTASTSGKCCFMLNN